MIGFAPSKPLRLTAAVTLALGLVACGGKISDTATTTTTTTTTTQAMPTLWEGKWVFSVNDAIGHCETEYTLKDGNKAYTGRFTYEIAKDGSFVLIETVWPKSSCDKLTDTTQNITSISQLESEVLGTISFRGKFTNYVNDGSIQVKDSQTGEVTSTGLRGTGKVQSLHDATSVTFSSGLSGTLANTATIQRKNQKHTGVVVSLDAPAGGKKDALCFVDRPLEQNHATLIGDKASVNGGDWHCHFTAL